jgi:UDPglucose 6-dehydrogenase
LQAAGANIRAFDPASMEQAKTVLSDIQYHTNAYDCIEQSDALVIVTEWDAFRALDLDRVKASLRTPIVVDLRNIYRPEIMQSKGFEYSSIGRM